MDNVGVAELQHCVDAVLSFLEPYWSFVNCHMVNYLIDDHWAHMVPHPLRAELQAVDHVHQAIKTFFSQTARDSPQFPALAQFLETCERHCLAGFPQLLTSVEQLEQLLPVTMGTHLSIKEFMSAKKCHEVEQTAALINKLVQSTTSESSAECYIVDAGDGKGYLSSRLALQYGHRVLGIDAKKSNTENALARNSKLKRAWNGLTERAELQSQGITPPRRGKKLATKATPVNIPVQDNYKTTSRFITTELNLCDLLKEHFVQELKVVKPRICLTGLHTCGNLAATCLQVFHAQDICRVLCSVGCCYHLLRERYSQQEFYGNKALMEESTDYGFPLSRHLQQRGVCLGRNARMLAAQSIERTLSAKELPNITIFYRALLEILVCRRAPHLKNQLKVGKVHKFNNFIEYVQICAKKLGEPWLAAVGEAELVALLQQHDTDRHYLSLFYLLRMSFAPVLESVILLDRLLYLKELGYEHSYLIDLFDAVISPRHYAIVALKP
ncbi:probable methyltransferase-like protein 25 [Drosophila montana]|uniref:probable methyltransferase-like protein 25 n=1 Tax=Drosophila montana TaxID=40370 RepID=UPI00313EDFCB